MLLIALVTAKRVSDSDALSVSICLSCLQFAPELTKVSFHPNCAFVPKVVDADCTCPSTELAAFHPPPFYGAEVEFIMSSTGSSYVCRKNSRFQDS